MVSIETPQDEESEPLVEISNKKWFQALSSACKVLGEHNYSSSESILQIKYF